jgi:outer membrane protein assembly factor BamB
MSTNAPASWDPVSGNGVLWKVESLVPGFNSPLIFGGNIYMAGGDASKLEVLALRLADGQLSWRQPLQRPPAGTGQATEIPESTGYAPSTMATDGRRIYAIFADGNLGGFTLDGKPAWVKSFGSLKNAYGHATSLATWKDRLIVQLDQGDSEEGKSVLYALDGKTGRPVWQRPRKLGASWASPIVIEVEGKPQIITLSLPWVISYSAADGSELWRVDCLNGEITPSPIFAGGFVIIASPSDRILAIRPDGSGDITKTNVVWSFDENVPDVTSPVSNGELVFMVTTSGTLTCVDIKDGKKVWDHELEMECHASPAIAGDRLYQFGQDGTAVVLHAGREYKELFRGKMPDSFHASPAFVNDKIVLRGVTNIWCLGPGKGAVN